MAWKSNRVMWDCNDPYAYRNDNLRALGFKSYRSYLKSVLWASIKARVIERDRGKCGRCGRKPPKPHVHHRAYDPATLRGDSIDALVTVCPGCHKRGEQPENLRRSRHDRLQDSSYFLTNKHRQKKKRTPEEKLFQRFGARLVVNPKGPQVTGPRKRSEV